LLSPGRKASRPTVGFSGSGGAGETSSPKNYFAGSRRILGAAKPLSAANGVGRFLLCRTYCPKKDNSTNNQHFTYNY